MANKTSYWLKIFGAACILAGVVIAIHQTVTWNVIFEADDFLHHENFTIILIGIGVAVLVTVALIGKKNRGNRSSGRKQ